MFKFPEAIRIPLADWVDAAMDWILANLGALFDAIGTVILQILLAVEDVLLFLPWFVILLAVGALAWKAFGNIWKGLGFMVLLFIIGTFGYWDLAMMTLAIIISSVFLPWLSVFLLVFLCHETTLFRE